MIALDAAAGWLGPQLPTDPALSQIRGRKFPRPFPDDPSPINIPLTATQQRSIICPI